MRRMGFNMVDHAAWLGPIRHPPAPSAWLNEGLEPSKQPLIKTNIAISRAERNRTTMADLTALFMALIWPGALVISVLAVSRTLIVVARSGVRVEIFTRQPILISTGNAPLRAEVGKVRI